MVPQGHTLRGRRPMHLVVRTISALALLGILAGCYPPTQTAYAPVVVEQPQPVHFFYGRLIDVRPATLEYGQPVGIAAKVIPRWPVTVGAYVGGNGPAVGPGVSLGVVDVLVEASVPNLPAIEYTVMLDHGTYPPDPYLDPREPTAAVVVVQNQYPADAPLQINNHVVVRVVGKSGR